MTLVKLRKATSKIKDDHFYRRSCKLRDILASENEANGHIPEVLLQMLETELQNEIILRMEPGLARLPHDRSENEKKLGSGIKIQ